MHARRAPGDVAVTLHEADYVLIRTLLHGQAGVCLEGDRREFVKTRLMLMASRQGLESIEPLLSEIRARQALPVPVLEELLIGETLFFRDLHPFEAIRTGVLPELLRRRGAERRLSMWSAACSSGQEPYSLAMLLRENFLQRVEGWDCRILATDLSGRQIARAREARYTHLEVNRGLPARCLVRHFEREPNSWRLLEEVRRMVEFRSFNLLHLPGSIPPMDVILLRNVLIYFDMDTRRSVLAHVRRLLRPDGMLFLGSAETTLHLDDGFVPVTFGRSVGYRLRGGSGGLS